jgi:hypothetical protein
MKVLSFVAFGLTLAACASSPPRKPASAPPTEPKALESLLNFELSPGERWKGGSKEAEVAGFVADANAVRAASEKLYRDNEKQTRSGRVFHEKSHGCLTGTLTVRGERPQDPEHRTNVGLFAAGASYPVIGRFSNGVGVNQHDADPDVRGLALKIFAGGDVPVDFLMTNATNPLGRDLDHFVEFMNAQVRGNLATLGFVKRSVDFQKSSTDYKTQHDELPYLRHFARSVLAQIDAVERERYWGGHPYLFGPNLHMKFNVQPADYSEQDQFKYDHRGDGVGFAKLAEVFGTLAVHRLGRPADYLRRHLKETAAAGPIHYVLNVQLEVGPVATPIENALVEWEEKYSPSIPVADIVFDQQNFDQPARDEACSRLRFTPGHFHPEHRPAGNMGRGRLFAYFASQAARPSDEQSPDAGIVERWRAGKY